MTTKERKEWLEEHETAVDMDMAEIEGCSVELLQLGKSNFLELEDEQIEEILSGGAKLAKDVREMFPRKPGSTGLRGRQTLIFYRQYWKVIVTHKQAKAHEGVIIDVESGKILNKASADKTRTLFLFEDLPLSVKKSGKFWVPTETQTVGFMVQDKGLKWDTATFDDILKEMHPDFGDEDIKSVRHSLRKFTCAGYKSLLQKIIRFVPELVEVPGKKTYPADFYLSVACVELMLSAGSFVPDIQRFVSGLESMVKRLAVIFFEESYVDKDTKGQLLTLCASAFLAQRVKSWKPSRELVVVYLNIATKAWKQNSYFHWKDAKGITPALPPYTFKQGNTELQFCSALLDEVRSFASDLAMVRYIAKNYDTCYKTPKVVNRPKKMPLCHCIDQHWAPEIVYFMPYKTIVAEKVPGSQPYSQIFGRVWREGTGVNPRKIANFDPVEYEKEKFVLLLRFAQRTVMEAKQIVPTERKAQKTKGSYTLSYTLDNSWISGMVGAVEISGRPTILTTLLPDDPEQIVAVRKPSRDMKDATLTVEQEEKAMRATRELLIEGLPLNKTNPPIPILKGAKLVLKETEEEDDAEEDTKNQDEAGEDVEEEEPSPKSRKKVAKKKVKEESTKLVSREYFIKTKDKRSLKWEDIREDKIEVPYLEPITENIFQAAVRTFGDGMQQNAFEELQKVLKASTRTAIRRMLMYISGFRQSFEMGRVSRDGGGTKQAVVVEDVGAFALLMRISVLFPSALRRRKGTATTFDVPLAPLLWKVREFVSVFLAEDVDYKSSAWGDIEDSLKRTPWQHQLDSLEEMKEAHHKGRKGHFIWIPVGMGKTWIVLSYLNFLKTVDKLPKYIVYTLPSSAIKSIIHEIQSFGFALNLVIPTKNSASHPLIKFAKHPGKSEIDEFTVNLIEHDHLRLCEETLASIAPQSIFIIDEVHKALNETKRTSVALSLSHLAEEFIALTGTPIIDSNTYKLIWWLEQIVPFEVNEKNFWVAANGMVAKKVNTGVIVKREEVIAEMTAEEKEKYFHLVPPGLGGKNSNFSSHNLRTAIDLCYEACTKRMIEITVDCVKKEKKGVMLVAHNGAHQSQLLKGLVKSGIKEQDIFLLSSGNSIFLTDQAVEEKKEHDYKVVITTIRKSEGYTLTRLKVLVTSVYPSNNATREQMEGRINRIGQKAKEVKFYAVHVGILSYILKKHKDARNLSAVLETLADEIKFIKGPEFVEEEQQQEKK
eukprot:TRINITY_DN1851_c0_g1_i1.p1 TRINITY_DN1851_c0_g1~~TRINITY_DN1851_c0_g1_i1.p1  ORF type:complete len:1221 (+),score=281.09 TRINITY_DN1851_c0_g1_i1:456-4118(+)